jgi:threonine dehydrogenase-like Zn-dependent dehydrogenase
VADCLSLGLRAPHELAFFSLDLPALDDGAVAVQTLYSGVSAGTELGYVKGTDPAFTSRHDRDLGVFLPGEGSRRYPIPAMGYMEVGQVVESRRTDLAEGALVAAAYGHRSCHVLASGDLAVPVPPDVDPLLGIYLAQMGPICANGLLHAAAELAGHDVRGLGDGVRDRTVLVTGGGVVGLLTALFAVHHGARDVALAVVATRTGRPRCGPRVPVPRSDRRPLPGPAEPAPSGCGDRPGLLPGRRSRAAAGRGVPPQRADRPLCADRPRAARPQPGLGPSPAG